MNWPECLWMKHNSYWSLSSWTKHQLIQVFINETATSQSVMDKKKTTCLSLYEWNINQSRSLWMKQPLARVSWIKKKTLSESLWMKQPLAWVSWIKNKKTTSLSRYEWNNNQSRSLWMKQPLARVSQIKQQPVWVFMNETPTSPGLYKWNSH